MSGISKNQRFRIVIPSHTGELHLLDKFMSSIKKWKPVYWLWSLQKACGLSRLIFTFANVFQFSFLFITIRINHFWYVTITLYENTCHCYNNCHCTYCVPLFYVCSTFCAHCLCFKYICIYIYIAYLHMLHDLGCWLESAHHERDRHQILCETERNSFTSVSPKLIRKLVIFWWFQEKSNYLLGTSFR